LAIAAKVVADLVRDGETSSAWKLRGVGHCERGTVYLDAEAVDAIRKWLDGDIHA
jgi:hypothetical protein